MRAILLFVALSFVACGGPSTTKIEPGRCVPGESRLCACGPGVEGVQACTNESVFETCQCDGPASDMGLPDVPDVSVPEDDTGACIPESDAALCAARSATCGSVSTTDRCGATRALMCGTCTGDAPCVSNSCCVAESDQALCTAAAATCGAITATDRCGQARTVSSCGVCTDSQCVANQCACSVLSSFYGQIGGPGPHEGGVPTTIAPTGDAGLSQIAAAMPLTDGAFAAVNLLVTGATVVATTFDSRANETFWLQDGATVAAVRLAVPSIFVDVRVGDRVNFRATQLQNFEGHPQISALQEFVITTRDNSVQYADRTGQPITIADYGKVVRVAGTVGAGVSCGGASLCYPLTHGTRVITFRSASTFISVGDCLTFVGPVSSFPGPLAAAAEPQLDVINFDWAFTQF